MADELSGAERLQVRSGGPCAAARACSAPRCNDSMRGVQIATDFILHAPYGELREVVADVQVLCGGEAVLADDLPVVPGSRRRCAERASACRTPRPLTVTPAPQGIVRQYNHARRVAAEGQV